MPVKRRLYILLNERARNRHRGRTEHERDADYFYWTDPRKDRVYGNNLTRNYPLIEDEESDNG
jgi:hypothetical protein